MKRFGPDGFVDDEPVVEEPEEEEPPPEPEPERAWRTTHPALLERSLRWEKLRVFGDHEPPQIHIREPKVHVEPEAWNIHRLIDIELGAPVMQHYRPPDIGDCLNTSSPQALLRDLFRPVKKYGVTDHDFIETGYTPGDMAKESIEIGTAGRLKIASVLPPPRHASDAMVEEMTRYRTFLADEWKIPPKTVYDGPEQNPFDQYGLLKSLGEM